MLSVALMLIILDDVVNRPPKGQMHPEWGPEPPVAPMTLAPLSVEKSVVPIIFPIVGQARWKNDFGDNRGRFRHTGIDIKAAKMSPIVAPFRGVIGFKSQSFWIYGDNGWTMLGTHLNDDNLGRHDHRGSRDLMFAPNLVPGDTVEAGQFIGYVGESGDATAPHLHFEMYRPGTTRTAYRVRNPVHSLAMAQHLAEPRVTILSHDMRNPVGQPRLIGCVRRVDEAAKSITLILLATQPANGEMKIVTSPKYERVVVRNSVATKLGDWNILRRLPPGQMIEVRYRLEGNQKVASELNLQY